MFANLGKISELSKLLSVKSDTCDVILRLMGRFGIGRTLSRHSLDKMRGRDLAGLIMSMMVFRILGETVGAMHANRFYGVLETGKNCYYRLLARREMDWRLLLGSMALRFQSVVRKEDAEETMAPKCYIIDDTTIEKTGFRFEGLSRVFDHVKGICLPGFKLLMLAFFDGKSTYAADMSLHREAGRRKDHGLSKSERSRQYSKERSSGDPDCRRYQELDMKKTDCAVEMIRRAWKRGFRASYALMDTWFVSASLVKSVREIGDGAIHVVGRLKMGADRYADGGRRHNVHELIALHSREAKACHKYKCMYFEVRVKMGDVPVKIFFVKVGRNRSWNAIVTTDMRMSFMKAFETYQIRWNIEVMFKECRQYLGLGRYQGVDFDAQIADCTLCLMTHMVLTLGKRFSEYETMGELFRVRREELLELTQWKRNLKLIERLLVVLAEKLGVDISDTMACLIDCPQPMEEIDAFLRILQQPGLRERAVYPFTIVNKIIMH